MTNDEVLLFKHYDSDVRLTGRNCFHTAFNDPACTVDMPPRESIEVRALAFFPDAKPSSLPKAILGAKDGDGAVNVEQAAFGILSGFDNLEFWPKYAIVWL